MAHEHSSFYALQLGSVLVWWALVRRMTGKHLYDLCSGSVLTRPSWLRTHVVVSLTRWRRLIVALAQACGDDAAVAQALAVARSKREARSERE